MMNNILSSKDTAFDVENPKMETDAYIELIKIRMDVLFDEFFNQTSFFTRTKQL